MSEQPQQATAPDQEGPVLLRRDGHAAHIVLNRPKAINALTHEMVGIMQRALEEWAQDDSVQTIVLTGAGERGLCAGGDIVALWKDANEGGHEAADFWADEYRLNAYISRYPKPYVAIMDGIVLGGGIGVSAHSSHRVVTERSSIGMPETGIGFLPDVGGTHLLSLAPGETGTHLALTAGRIGAGDAIATGFADSYVPSERLPQLLEDLGRMSADEALQAAAQPAPESDLLAQREWIDRCYAGDDAEAIAQRLEAEAEGGNEPAAKALKAIRRNSPMSVAVTLRALRQSHDITDLPSALDLEYRLALRFHGAPDFVEGVRAQVIDKDRNPKWTPATLAEVSDSDIEAYFATLGDDELGLADSLRK